MKKGMVFLAIVVLAVTLAMPAWGIERKKRPCEVQVTSPVNNQLCYINEICTISWNLSSSTNYGSVFLHVVQIDSAHPAPTGWEGGGYPVSNTGSYQWVVPENVGPLENTSYRIKIATSDLECIGVSPIFSIKKRLPMDRLRKDLKLQ